jgi:hypothetical protein
MAERAEGAEGAEGSLLRVDCWVVRDTGLHAAPGPFRRLPGAVRHHRGRGGRWPERCAVEVGDEEVSVDGVGSWPRHEVSARRVAGGPPVTFVLQLPDASQLLATAAGPTADALLAALTP